MALQRVLGGDHFLRRERPAAAPASHRVGLRRRTANHRAVAHALGQDLHEVVRHRVVDQLLVAEIDQDPDPAPCRLVCNPGQILFGDQRAGGIAGRVDDHAPGLRRDRRQERVGPEAEPVVGMGVDDHRRCFGELDLLDQRRPARHVRDHFVARPEEHHGGVVERLLAAGGDDDLAGRELDAVIFAIAELNRLLELLGAGVGRVFREIAVDRCLGRVADVARRREVRLPCSEVDDVDALRLQLDGLRGHFHRR